MRIKEAGGKVIRCNGYRVSEILVCHDYLVCNYIYLVPNYYAIEFEIVDTVASKHDAKLLGAV